MYVADTKRLTNEGAKRDVGLAWDKSRDLSPPAQRFAAFLSNDASSV